MKHKRISMKHIGMVILISSLFNTTYNMYQRTMTPEESDAFQNAMQTVNSAVRNVSNVSRFISGSNIVSINGRTYISGNSNEDTKLTGIVSSKEYKISSPINKIKLNNALRASITIDKNAQPLMKISGDTAILDKVVPDLENGKLSIGLESCSYFGDAQLQVVISVPDLSKLGLNGASKATLQGEFEDITVKANGASRAILEGFAKNVTLKANGASNISAAQKFKANNASVKCNGASNVKIYSLETIKMAANGASNIGYSGIAKVLSQKAEGFSNITEN